ncbi:MAG: hypothetical protein LH629_14260 [Ignavibacteria bacterium]|nr:hypothetical protein [Ignavibacteria bacterium]
MPQKPKVKQPALNFQVGESEININIYFRSHDTDKKGVPQSEAAQGKDIPQSATGEAKDGKMDGDTKTVRGKLNINIYP